MKIMKNRVGERFGRLILLSQYRTKTRSRAKCLCDCGKETDVAISHLATKHTLSCGCLHKERLKESLLKSNQTHKESTPPTPEYKAWSSMKDRCKGYTSRDRQYYVGRGITIYPKWEHNYAAFLSHIGRKPSQNHSLDRINNNKGYEPGNVRWATPKEQANNRRRPRQGSK